jgi:hypothetical protein
MAGGFRRRRSAMTNLDGLPDKPRRRRTKARVQQLERQIIDELEDDHPQSVRHVFYRMTNPRLPEPVEKTPAGYNQVQQRLTKMRRAGAVPYGWITDATRRGYHVNTFNGAADFIARMHGLYRSDLWASADHFVEVWCESRSIAGVIEDDCRELAVSLYPCGGFASISLVYSAAEQINDTHDGKPVEVVYVGDYDDDGVLIDQTLERELREHLDPAIALTFHRIAITLEQIAEYDLPTKPRKAGDRRAQQVEATVEAEAMPAHILRELLRDKVESFLPPRALAVAKVAEKSERQILWDIAEAAE